MNQHNDSTEILKRKLKIEMKDTPLSQILELPLDAMKGVSSNMSFQFKELLNVSTISEMLDSTFFQDLLHFYELRAKLELVHSKKKYVKIYSKKEKKDIYVCIDEDLPEEELVNRLVALSNSVTTG